MSAIKLVFCTDGIYPQSTGGMQKHSRLLIEQLAREADLSITVLHPHGEKLFDGNVKEVFITPIDPDENYLRECYRYSKRVAFELDRLEYDVIYAQGLCVWAGIDKYKDRLIINPHGLEPYQALGIKNKLLAVPFKLIFNRLFRKARYVISLGGRLTGILEQRISSNKIVAIPNAVNIPDFAEDRTFEADRCKVVFIARFASNKGIDILFKAIEVLHNQGVAHKFEFVLGGKGPLYEHYKSVNKYANVVLKGYVTDEEVRTLYREGDLFALPTLFEGMPTVVLEAMSYGLPVVVTDVGATAELVDEQNGILIEKNSVSSLVSALLAFLNMNNNQKQLMSRTAVAKVKGMFTWNVVGDKHMALFQQIARKG